MSDAETKPTMTTIVLVAILVLNVLGIGLSEVQRRQLGQQSFLATLELRDVEKQRLEQQAQELDRLYKLIANIDQRISKVQVALESGPLALQVKDIQERMNAVQIKMEQASSRK
jgi:uncharacterized protein HemX